MPNLKRIILFASLSLAILGIVIAIMMGRKGGQEKEKTTEEVPAFPVESNFERINVPENEDVQGIKRIFDDYVKKDLGIIEKEKGYSQTQLVDENNRPISLDVFSKAVGIKINRNIRNILNQDDFVLVRCNDENSQSQRGIILNVKLFKSFPDLYDKEIEWMKEWEPTMLSDLHKVLFPNVAFDEAYLNKPLQFREGKYRYAEIELPDGMKSSINYNIVFDSIIITTSLPCLEKISLDCETPEP